MSLRLFLLVIASVALSAVAQLALKAGTGATAARRPAGVMAELGALAQAPLVWLGLGLYALGAVLSLAYPFVGLGFILTMLAGALVFHEPLGPARVAGTVLIALGAVLVARSA
jgi:multidrug transporter EmrE-like cation transporter